MEVWFMICMTLCLSLILKFIILDLVFPKSKLPPGPLTFPVIGNVFWLLKSAHEIEQILRGFKAKYGPVVTIRVGSNPTIFITSHALAHEALIQKGAIFADRPPAVGIHEVISSKQHHITSAAYGPTWRLLRRNLSSEILHSSSIRAYSGARRWVLDLLISRLNSASQSGDPVTVYDHFRFSMFCLLVLMCFGDKLEENQIREIETVQSEFILGFEKYSVLNFWPRLTRILLRKQWNEFLQLRKHQKDVLIPLIKARIKAKQENHQLQMKEGFVPCYVDSFPDLEYPDEKRKLRDEEMVSLCSEFLSGGTDTTTTTLQWTMANLVKYPRIQSKLYEEIKRVVEEKQAGQELERVKIEESDAQKMHYLRAVVLETLRRHPPAHIVLPHAVTEDVMLNGYLIPRDAIVNFSVSDMGWDAQVWEDPMVFKPERFMNDDDGGGNFDLTGSKELKMMPFGVGRRICPGLALGMLHLEYFLANLVWYFEWTAVDGDDVDLSERPAFTIVMKHPLKAHITPRFK